MAPLNMISILGLAASVLALPQSGTGTHLRPSGTHVKHSGTGAKSHVSGTAAASASKGHIHGGASHSHKVHFDTSAVISSADAFVTDIPAKYNAGDDSSSNCGTVTSKIRVTVTITAEDTAQSAAGMSVATTSAIVSTVPVVVSPVAVESSNAAISSTQVAVISSSVQPAAISSTSSSAVVAVSTQPSSSTTDSEAATAYGNKAYGQGWNIPSAAVAAHNSNQAAVHISAPDVIHFSSVLVEPTSTPVIQYTPTTTAVATHTSSTSVQVYTAATSAASSATSTSTSSKPAQRGVAYNDASLVDSLCSSEKIGWAFNWASTSGGLPSGVQFIPTLWGPADQFTGSWIKNAKSAISSGSEYLFSFNEPDIESQANLTASVAAAAYKTWVSDPFKNSGAKLCAPAVTNGDPDQGYGLGWLKSFMGACEGCQVDCINIHWYGNDVDALKTQVTAAITQARLWNIQDVFLSEFGLNGASAATVSTFLDSALPFLEAQQNLTGYAYFMLSNGILASGNSLNAAGQTYMDFAT